MERISTKIIVCRFFCLIAKIAGMTGFILVLAVFVG